MADVRKGDIVQHCDGSVYVVLEVNGAGKCRLSTMIEMGTASGQPLSDDYFFGFPRGDIVIGNVEDQDGV